MPTPLKVITVVQDEAITRMAQTLDLFEPFKVYGRVLTLKLTLKPDCTHDQAVQDSKFILEQAGKRVVAIFTPDDLTAWRYRDESVQVVSNGQNWFVLDEMLASFGWPKEPV